jgi:hypothetical protein
VFVLSATHLGEMTIRDLLDSKYEIRLSFSDIGRAPLTGKQLLEPRFLPCCGMRMRGE